MRQRGLMAVFGVFKSFLMKSNVPNILEKISHRIRVMLFKEFANSETKDFLLLNFQNQI
jgi:hypothetical protein